MTLGDIGIKARNLTATDTSSYTDANLLIDINVWNAKVADMIYGSQDDSDFDDQRQGVGGSSRATANYPMQTTPLIALQRDYSFGTSEKVLKYKRVDITYDGVNWYRAEPIDDGSIPYGLGDDSSAASVALTDQNFIRQAPRYDVKYGAIFIYPAPIAADVAAGGKIRAEWERNITPFTIADYTSVLTDSTQVPGFDDPFHPILAYGAAYEYANSRNLPQLQNIKQDLQDWEQRLRTAYGRKDLDVRVGLTAADISYK